MQDDPKLIDLDDDDIEGKPGVVDDDEDDEELREIFRKALATDGEPEPGVMPPLPRAEDPTVSAEDGMRLLEEAKLPTAKKDDAAPLATEPAKPAAEVPVAPATEGAKPDSAAPASAPDADLDALLSGIDADRGAKIRARLEAASAWDAIANDRKDQLSSIAATPQEAIGSLLHIHNYANQNPDQYLAWAAWQLGGDDPAAVLTKAAEHLGLKVIKAEPVDEFEDETTKRLREENAQLRAQANGGRPVPFGPDVATPQDDLARFVNEKTPDGQLKRPFWGDLHPIIAQRAMTQRNDTGKPVTVADLDTMYVEEVARLQQKLAPSAQNSTVAAQQPAPVAQNPGNDKAADRIAKAKAASTSIDGTGQGADRQAAPEDDSIDAILRFNLAKMRGN